MITPQDTTSDPAADTSAGDVAIIGMGCLFAGAPDLDTYWRNIVSKVDAIADPPADEWDPKIFYDPESISNDRVYCKRGGYIGAISQFRPTDFGVMPIAVDGGEPDQWLALRVAKEALADAGYAASPKEHVRTEVVLGKGTYINRGNMTVGYHAMMVDNFLQVLRNLHPEYTDSELRAIKEEMKAGLPPFSADTAPALIGNIIAGRIANRLDFMGPSFTVDAACASALLAIEIGVRDLLSHKYDLVLAGGANVNAPLPTMSLFCQLGALSRKEQIRPFDKMADGTILGEGLGMIVLKRRKDAERDSDRIYAVIKGVGVASDGRALQVMAPRVEGEELALRRAFEMAGISPGTVGLIEAHGTATPVGDVVEVQALSRIFGGRQGPLPSCAIGSVKSMIGHTMPAAGIAGIIKTALALYHRVLPPTLNCDEPNPALGLDQTPFYVNTETRPWIHAADTPRRAGVNSFGFGGINAHVILEEHPAEMQDARGHQLQWETEVCVIEAESRQMLLERCGRLREYSMGTAEAPLKDIAYSLNSRLHGQPCRLAIVAASREELAQKLASVMDRLASPQCRQIKDNSGIYFFEQPLAGKLAFLFPGEGAQYPNMLLELCLHFPEVRTCFDEADRALTLGSRKVLPSEFIFPRSILSESERSEMEQALWRIEGAVEGVLIANWAMWTLLKHLQIRPDVIVGHSTGDYSAMVASNIIDLNQMIVEWNSAHGRLAETVVVPEVVLLAVAADSATVLSIVEEVGGDIYLAMDNCPHQNVLAGSKAATDKAVEHLRRRGLIYEVLPFDRPYHTPMFQAYAEGAGEEFFARLAVAAPNTELYSCTTASAYPLEAAEIRKLFVAHWVLPVMFTQTVKKMYDDGVRLFVEAGPRGNLTAFVSDILRGKPHLAMAANLPRRSALTQINHLVGVLAAQGVAMRSDYLYARRNPQRVPWEDAHPPGPTKQPVPMKLSLGLPPLKVSPRAPKAAPMVTRAKASSSPTGAVTVGVRELPVHQPAAIALPAPPPDPVRAPASRSAAPLVMQDYFKGMEAFLDVESQVMAAFINRHSGSNKRDGGESTTSKLLHQFPLLGTVTSIIPSQDLTAVLQLSLRDHLFLRDHALAGPVSVTSPDLQPLIVLPLTMSIEILAEAASALMPGQVLVGMRDIQAHHWIQVDDVPVELKISAHRSANSPEISVQVWNMVDAAGQRVSKRVLEGTMIFAHEYPVPPTVSVVRLTGERRSTLASTELYDGRLMFHGPCFQGVVSVDRSGQNGAVGTLRTLPTDNLLRTIRAPQFVTDPVVLDAAGQLVGFWAAEYLERGFVVFPYSVKSLDIYCPSRPAGERVTCHVHLRLEGGEGVLSDMEIAAADGAVWMRIRGWADRRFDPPPQFHRAWTTPRDATISEPWETPIMSNRGADAFECYRLDSLFAPGASLWKELWASLVLTRRERKSFAEHKGPEHRRMEWLSGRTAAKDAVRGFLLKHHGLELLPADIEILQDEFGRPTAGGAWLQRVREAPQLSIAHSDGVAVALAAADGNGRRVGIDLEKIRELKPDFETVVFTGEERRVLDAVPPADRAEWILRLWCVKEAISKALGRGLIEGPQSVRVLALDTRTGFVEATPHGKLAEAVPDSYGQSFASYTARDGEYVVATAIYEKQTL